MRKNFLLLFLAILGCLACAIGFAACETEPAHVHTLVHKPAVKAICTSNGTVEYWLCTGCNKKFSDESATTEINDVTDPAIGHDYGEWTETKAATCTTEGIEKRYCSHDSAHTQTRYIPALGHGTPSDWIIDTEAACETAGKKHKECTVCHAVVETATIPALRHNYGSYTSNGDATCTADGTETRTCSLCGKKDTRAEENSALGHSKGKTIEVVSPVCGKQGYTTYSCSVCGETFNADIQPALEHDFDSEWVCTLCGYEYATEGLVYGRSSSGGDHYEVYKYNGKSPQVIIPAHHNGLPVTSIGGGAFEGCSSLTSINIPDSVTSIYGSAFKGCSSLTSINLPDGVTYIGINTFEGCSSLTSINIPDGVTYIGQWAFGGCIGLTSITIPDSITSIGVRVFCNCTGLTSIKIPDSVTSIGGGGVLWLQ